MSIGPWQIILVVVLVVLLFGRGKISELMGDVAKGIKSFKKGIKEEDDETVKAEPAKTIDHDGAASVDAASSEKSSVS